MTTIMHSLDDDSSDEAAGQGPEQPQAEASPPSRRSLPRPATTTPVLNRTPYAGFTLSSFQLPKAA